MNDKENKQTFNRPASIIFLIGFMGSGKTTLARKLAVKLNNGFIDLDNLLEAKAGMGVAHYFKEFGETAFRELERDVLQKSEFPENTIIATGGGTPCYFNNMEWMNANGITIYISLPAQALANRLENSKKTDRPLLQNLHGEDLVDFIAGKLAERESFYNQAKFVVSGTDLTAEKLVDYLQMIS